MEIITTIEEAGEKIRSLNQPPQTQIKVILQDTPQEIEWKQHLRKAKGIWKNRTDLPDFEVIRSSLDRRIFNPDSP